MIRLELAEIARLTGGQLTGGADPTSAVTGPVVIDSRRAEPGGLFVCLPGERVDGHDFAAAAVAAGAVAALAAREVDAPAVVVADPQQALAVLATAVLERMSQCTVVGVTGSSGKTSTKDLLGQVLARLGPTVAPENSFNNELGLPLTVLRVTARTRTLVCEYSARSTGHIAELCRVAPPQVGIVLNVGTAHLGEFGSREAIAAAKGELVEALPPPGTAILNADDRLVLGMAPRTRARVMTFGLAASADVRVTDLELDDLARPRFHLRTPQGGAQVALTVSGIHHAFNAAAVTAAGLALELDLAEIADALSTAVIRSPHRMDVRTRADGLTVIDDAYNANPESMQAALLALGRLAGGRRRWAVLGEMLELGDESDELHRQLGRVVALAGVEELVAVGATEALVDGATATPEWQGRARLVPDAAAATTVLRDEVDADDVVLVKASNSIQLWDVADALMSLSAGARA